MVDPESVKTENLEKQFNNIPSVLDGETLKEDPNINRISDKRTHW